MKPPEYGLVTFFCGMGGKTLGPLRARGREGSRFVSVGAFDLSPDACRDFETLTGAPAQVVDLGVIEPAELARRCVRRPDMIAMSPPCVGFSGCLPEGLSKTEKYQALNALALRAVNLALESWATPPAIILLENVPRMRNRGANLITQIKALLWAADYEVDIRSHDCGEIGNLAQHRHRLLIVARHRTLAPTPLLVPPNLGTRSMAEVLWSLPVPAPGSHDGGRLHRLPRLAPINWVRLASIRAGRDWRDIPAAIRLPEDSRRHAGKYGVQDPSQPAHTVIAEVRTGKGWADVADPRCGGNPKDRHSGLYGVNGSEGPSHAILAAARAGSPSWASVTDPRLGERASRQNGGFGVNDATEPSHSVLAEGSVRNTFAAVTDARLHHAPREGGSHGVADSSLPSVTVLGRPGIANGTAAIADTRVKPRRNGMLGVGNPNHPSATVVGAADIQNSPVSIADMRVKEQYRGSYGVEDPTEPSRCVRAKHNPRTAPASVADSRAFAPTHRLIAGQLPTVSREDWVAGDFQLEGPTVKIERSGGKGSKGPCHMVIEAPDGTFHRPLTTLELAVLQGFPAWHRPGDPTELELGEDGGQWLDLAGNKDASHRERVGNAVPVSAAKAIGEQALAVLDAGATEVFRLSVGGVWVAPELGSSIEVAR